MSNITLPIGSISEGSCKVEDLFSSLCDALESVALSGADAAVVRSLKNEFDGYVVEEEEDMFIEDMNGIYDELLALAENYLPEGYYLGMHEGDGANLGVWFNEEDYPDDDEDDLDDDEDDLDDDEDDLDDDSDWLPSPDSEI